MIKFQNQKRSIHRVSIISNAIHTLILKLMIEILSYSIMSAIEMILVSMSTSTNNIY